MASDAALLGKVAPPDGIWAAVFAALGQINKCPEKDLPPAAKTEYEEVLALKDCDKEAGTVGAAIWMGKAVVRLACQHKFLARHDIPDAIKLECEVSLEEPVEPEHVDATPGDTTEGNSKGEGTGDGALDDSLPAIPAAPPLHTHGAAASAAHPAPAPAPAGPNAAGPVCNAPPGVPNAAVAAPIASGVGDLSASRKRDLAKVADVSELGGPINKLTREATARDDDEVEETGHHDEEEDDANVDDGFDEDGGFNDGTPWSFCAPGELVAGLL